MNVIWAIFRFVAVVAALLVPGLASAGQLAPKAATHIKAIDVVVETSLKATSLCAGETRSAEAELAVEIASRSPILPRGGVLDSRSVWDDFGGFGEKLPNGSMAPSPEMLAQVLSKGTRSSRRVAGAIRRGDLEVFYGDLPSNVAGRYLEGTRSFAINRNYQWTGHNGLMRAAGVAAHEGQHYLDDIAGVATRGMKANQGYFEARAFLRQQQFMDSMGASGLGPLGTGAERAANWAKLKRLYGIK